MPEVGLDLDLASQLVLDVRLLQLLFEQNLEGDDVLAVLLASQVHVAELAAAQGFAYVEVAQLRGSGAGWMSARERWEGGCEGAPNFVFCVSVCDVRGNPPRRRRATASRLGRGGALSRGYRVDTYLPTLLLLLNGRTGARGRRRGARGGGVLLAGTARGRCTRGLHDGRRLLERTGRVGRSGGHSGAVHVPLVCR